MLVMVSASSSRSKPTLLMATVACSRNLVLTWYAIASPAVPIMGKSLEQLPNGNDVAGVGFVGRAGLNEARIGIWQVNHLAANRFLWLHFLDRWPWTCLKSTHPFTPSTAHNRHITAHPDADQVGTKSRRKLTTVKQTNGAGRIAGHRVDGLGHTPTGSVAQQESRLQQTGRNVVRRKNVQQIKLRQFSSRDVASMRAAVPASLH